MKKITLLAAMALAATAAQAQFNIANPSLQNIADKASNKYFDILILENGCVDKLKAAGKTVQLLGPDSEDQSLGRNMYVWEGTFAGGDGSYPGVGWSETEMNLDGYTALKVADKGWSGAGFNIRVSAAKGDPTSIDFKGADFSHFTADTRFHLAYRTASAAPVSVALIILDGETYALPEKEGDALVKTKAGAPAKVAVGKQAYEDNGAIFPLVGGEIESEWKAIDVTFADLAKIYPSFNYKDAAVENWYGNVVSLLAGGVTGTEISLDAVYFYTPEDSSAAESIAADAVEFVYTGKTLNASGAAGIELYNLSGALVKAAAGTVLGTEDLAAGVYVAKAGNKAMKIVVK